MATTTKIIAIGNSAGIILPKEDAGSAQRAKGANTLCVAEAPLGVNLTPYDDEFMRKLESSERVMRKYRDALRKLAE